MRSFGFRRNRGIRISNMVVAILAIVAGVLILLNVLSLELIVGVFLILFGILTLTRR